MRTFIDWIMILTCVLVLATIACAQPQPPGPPAPLDSTGHWVYNGAGSYVWVANKGASAVEQFVALTARLKAQNDARESADPFAPPKAKTCGCGGDPSLCTCGDDCSCCPTTWTREGDYWIAYKRNVKVGAYHRSWTQPRRWTADGGDEPWNVPIPKDARTSMIEMPTICRT